MRFVTSTYFIFFIDLPHSYYLIIIFLFARNNMHQLCSVCFQLTFSAVQSMWMCVMKPVLKIIQTLIIIGINRFAIPTIVFNWHGFGNRTKQIIINVAMEISMSEWIYIRSHSNHCNIILQRWYNQHANHSRCSVLKLLCEKRVLSIGMVVFKGRPKAGFIRRSTA